MNAEHADGARLNNLAGRVIGSAFTVLDPLGTGFLGKVHETDMPLCLVLNFGKPRPEIEPVILGL